MQRVLIDACVLYPTVMREVVMGAAKAGLFEPIWSARLLEEWARAAARLGPEGDAQARAEIALLRTHWPKSERAAAPGVEQRLWLPDENDIHVLAVAIDASADVILTLNAKDFPKGTLAEEGVQRADPDGYLMGFIGTHGETLSAIADNITNTARQMSGVDWTIRSLLKKARLPRLAKALTR